MSSTVATVATVSRYDINLWYTTNDNIFFKSKVMAKNIFYEREQCKREERYSYTDIVFIFLYIPILGVKFISIKSGMRRCNL